MMKMRRGGFTLSEGVFLVVVLGLLVAVALPMLGAATARMRGLSSQQKLMLIGQGGMMYAQDNADRLFSYT